LQEEAVCAESQFVAYGEVFTVLRKLVDAFASTGMHSEYVKVATGTLEACETTHRNFSKEHISQLATLALTMGTLKDELSGASAGAPLLHHKPLSIEKIKYFSGVGFCILMR
jgi:hypothetical protein